METPRSGLLAAVIALAGAAALPAVDANNLARTPPMGWMSWEVFRCEVDCVDHPDTCVSEKLYQEMATRLAEDGFLDAGYRTVSIDDCWESNPRGSDGKLTMNASRFPSGPKALGDFMHGKGVHFGIYSDEGTKTCGGRPGSKGFEVVDADTFASWGVDYLKLDGCYNDKEGYVTGYPAMGKALAASGRDIVYSCSWPAYLGTNESAKPFDAMVAAGCNLWRNWDDIQCNWGSLSSIIDHWGDYGTPLQAAAGPGHWNDPDMLLIGNDCISDDEGETQMAIWSIVAAPLIMGNDLRNLSSTRAKATLLNREAIAVNQDSAGRAGLRLTPKGATEVWGRHLSGGDVAVALFNKGAQGSASGEAQIKFTLDQVGFSGAGARVRDIFQQKDLGVISGSQGMTLSVPFHGVRFLRLTTA